MIRLDYTDDYKVVHAGARAEIVGLDIDWESGEGTIKVKIYGSDAEKDDLDIEARHYEEIYLQVGQTTAPMRQAAAVLKDELEKILLTASPANGQLTSEADYSTGVIE